MRDFWVKNYLSIRDKQELSFLAKGPSSELVTEIADGVFLYKLGIAVWCKCFRQVKHVDCLK